jgi:acetylornithine deacetylase
MPLLIGHTDTVHVRGWSERWAGTERESPFGGALVDGDVWGRGASDLKAGLCTTIEAVRTLIRAGVPVDRPCCMRSSATRRAESRGAASAPTRCASSALIAKGALPKPDMAIYVEPTMLDVYVAHIGFFL